MSAMIPQSNDDGRTAFYEILDRGGWALRLCSHEPGRRQLEILTRRGRASPNVVPCAALPGALLVNSDNDVCYFCFKDLAENEPTGLVRMRVETIDYFLRLYREEIVERRRKEQAIEVQLAESG